MRPVWFGVAAVVVAAAGDAAAQPVVIEAALDPDRFVLTSDPASIALTESATPLAANELAVGLALRLGGAPLRICVQGDDGGCAVEGDLVGDRVGTDLTVAFGLGRVGLHAQLPVVLRQGTDFEPAMGEDALAAAGIGDLRLGAKAWLARVGIATIGADLTFSVPTGSGDFVGDDGSVIEPRAIVEARPGRLAVAASLGYAIRTAPATLADLHVDDELVWSLAAEYAVTPDRLGVGVAVFGRAGVIDHPDAMDASSDAERPAEALVSLRYWATPSLAVEAAAGTAVDAGYGAPSYRALAGVRWVRRAPPPPAVPFEPVVADRDGDGIPDDVDRCVDDPEDVDGFEDDDGCPDDDDGDGIADAVDQCRHDPEDVDGFEDDDGCPDLDNDRDGIADLGDGCPVDAEDIDGFEDDDGCPDLDNDGDGIADAIDACPLEPEVVNGVDDDDGCPDDATSRAVVTATAIEINETIYFDVDLASIKEQSFKLLDAVATALKVNAQLRIRIEGHTDETGSSAHNQILSEERAIAVRAYLIDKGIAEDRLEAAGFGRSRPKAKGRTKRARANNRRVEFVIID
jgi:outer membrane protein OmpA-like peptidoglycan-associated protein